MSDRPVIREQLAARRELGEIRIGLNIDVVLIFQDDDEDSFESWGSCHGVAEAARDSKCDSDEDGDAARNDRSDSNVLHAKSVPHFLERAIWRKPTL